jgi:hypothetical protein
MAKCIILYTFAPVGEGLKCLWVGADSILFVKSIQDDRPPNGHKWLL